jgi:hypothetical protein
MNVLQLSGMLPRDPQFREFVRDSLAALVRDANLDIEVGEVSIDEAAEFIRITCRIESRKELLQPSRAAERFHSLIRRPFVAWRDQQQPHRRAA